MQTIIRHNTDRTYRLYVSHAVNWGVRVHGHVAVLVRYLAFFAGTLPFLFLLFSKARHVMFTRNLFPYVLLLCCSNADVTQTNKNWADSGNSAFVCLQVT